MLSNDLWEDSISQRVEQILKKNAERQKQHFQEQEIILETLDSETREKFEQFAVNLALLDADECHEIYWQAFLDGLNLGHKAF